MSLNKFLSPNSGPLTSEPAIGWLGINIFFNFLFLLIKLSILRLVEPVSVIRFFEEMKTFVWKKNKAQAMKGHNDDLIMSLAIGCWLADSNSDSYNVAQIKYSEAMLQGMSVNKTDILQTNISPFYNSKEKYVNPFIPTMMTDGNFSSEPTRKNPLGDLSWLYKK